jgi:solute carrier family 45, member 1/2/4
MASSMASSAVDPDPTTQIAWPSGRKAGGVSSTSVISDLNGSYESESHSEVNPHIEPMKNTRRISHPHQDDAKPQGLKPLTKWNLFTLSLGMAGAQVAWTVELGYVTCNPVRICLQRITLAMAHRSSWIWVFLSK